MFHAWECITIQMENRDVDLVIRDEGDMLNLISLLVFELQTLDGQQGTASRVLKKFGDLRKTVSNKVIFKLKVMKWRMKISFMARSQKKTVKELFLSAILASYCMLFLQNRIPMTVSDLFKQQDEVFHKILMLPTPKCLAYVTHIHSDLGLHNLQDYYYLD